VYSIADTDLEPFMMQDVGEMGAVGTGEQLNFVALVDRAADYSSDPVLGVPDWEGAKLLRIGRGTADVLDDLGDLNTGDPQVLADFVARGISENPAATNPPITMRSRWPRSAPASAPGSGRSGSGSSTCSVSTPA
jgi:hypothetical protein